MLIKRYVIIWRRRYGKYNYVTYISIAPPKTNVISYLSIRVINKALIGKKFSRCVFDHIIKTKSILTHTHPISFSGAPTERKFLNFFNAYVNYNNNKEILHSYYVK